MNMHNTYESLEQVLRFLRGQHLKMLRPSEAAARMGVPVDEVSARVPACHIGKRTIRFFESDVDAVMNGISTETWARAFASQTKHAKAGTVYFIEAIGLDAVKIGWTAIDPKVRMMDLQTASPCDLRLVTSLNGTMAVEAGLHARFAPARIAQNREWFRVDNELRAFMERVERERIWP